MEYDRRTLLRAGLAVTVMGASSGLVAASAAADGGETDDSLELARRLDGEVRSDKDTRTAAADDFGHLLHLMPSGVLWPGSVQDIATTLLWASADGRPVSPQGQSHSVYGRSQVDGGIVIDMSKLRAIHHVGADRVVVDAGAKWSEVLAATLPNGSTPPVLTDYLDLSVGGTLVVGGIGGTTHRDGMQSDNVLELEVVTVTGQVYTCSPRMKADLFNAVRAGLGQVAVITKATLKLVPAPDRVRRCMLVYADLATLVADERKLVLDGRFDAVQGAILPTPGGWKYTLDAAAYFSGDDVPDDAALLAGLSDLRDQAQLSTQDYFAYLNRLAALEQLLRSNGQWFYPHPWLTTYVGGSNVESVVSEELANLTSADLGTYGRVVLSPLRRQPVSTPLLRLPDEDVSYAFNLVRIPTTNSIEDANRMVSANRAVYERVRAAGGTLYPVSAFPMSPDDWRAHFGGAWSQLSDAKDRYDPAHTLTPGYEVFP
jgi:cytokinin dehydrogenase